MGTNVKNATATVQAANAAFADQPGWLRRKSTLINLLQGLGWVLGALATVAADWPEWAVLLVGGLSTLVASCLSALTKGELTPSMAMRIAAYAPADTPDVTVDVPAVVDPATDYQAYIAAR